jgi:glutaredoxin
MSNYEKMKEVRKEKPVLVLYTRSDCLWCEKLKPEWKKINGITKIEINLSKEKDVDSIKSKEKFETVPTIKLQYKKYNFVYGKNRIRTADDIQAFVEKSFKTILKKCNKCGGFKNF